MIFRNLDENHDWTFGQGRANYIANNPAIGLNINTRLYSWVNDCFFDMTAGIDWYNRLGSKNQRDLLEIDLRRVILQSFGVTGLVSFSTSLTDRQFRADYVVNTIFSENYRNTLIMDTQNA